MPYPTSITDIPERSDGPSQLIYAAHMNVIRTALRDLNTVLGNAPQGNLANVEARLDLNIDDDGKLIGVQQCIFVAKGKTKYSTIQSAIDSISDAASGKRYTVLVFPGIYEETVTLKAYVDIVGISNKVCKILTPTDANAIIAGVANSNIYNIWIHSDSSVPGITSTGSSHFFNCWITSSGDDAIAVVSGSPVFDYCHIQADNAYHIDITNAYPTFRYCTIEAAGGQGGRCAAGMAIFYYCFMQASNNQWTTSSGAYTEFRFCVLGESLGGTGTNDKGTMDGTCTSPA